MSMREMTDPNDPMARKALLDQLGGDMPGSDITSTIGGQRPQVEPTRVEAPPTMAGAPAAPEGGTGAPAAPADYSRLNAGYNRDKLNDPNKQSAKYQIARTLNGFDPRQGITPEVVAALNKLGFGTYASKGGDKLDFSGLTDKGKAAGLKGDFTDADFIEAFKSGNGLWGYSDPYSEALDAQAAGAAQAPGAAGPQPGGNPLETSAVPTDANFFNKIMESLRQQAGPASTDRAALLAQMGIQ